MQDQIPVSSAATRPVLVTEGSGVKLVPAWVQEGAAVTAGCRVVIQMNANVFMRVLPPPVMNFLFKARTLVLRITRVCQGLKGMHAQAVCMHCLRVFKCVGAAALRAALLSRKNSAHLAANICSARGLWWQMLRRKGPLWPHGAVYAGAEPAGVSPRKVCHREQHERAGNSAVQEAREPRRVLRPRARQSNGVARGAAARRAAARLRAWGSGGVLHRAPGLRCAGVAWCDTWGVLAAVEASGRSWRHR